ncbi:hypothetical protein [Bhargavaea cecembensis]|uniref:hypothetical protein n=1 Tax=Bhargavaea cecembensis TaxID=394098 RepID=UPI001178A548|nr:hypothetical protein [Bhargavaea cecembensis]
MLTAVLVIVLSACSKAGTNTIKPADLSDRESAILSTFSDGQMVFDFKLDADFKNVTVWVEKYESGQLVNEHLAQLGGPAEQNGTIIFGNAAIEEKNVFYLGIQSGGNTGSSINIDDEAIDLDKLSSISGPFTGSEEWSGQERVLGDLCYSNKSSMRTLTPEFYEDPESHLDEIKPYEVVYLLKAKAER